jgi:hypothetical protein
MDNLQNLLDGMLDHHHDASLSHAGFADDNYHHTWTGHHDGDAVSHLVPSHSPPLAHPDSHLYYGGTHPVDHAIHMPDVFLDDTLHGVGGLEHYTGDPLYGMSQVRFPHFG